MAIGGGFNFLFKDFHPDLWGNDLRFVTEVIFFTDSTTWGILFILSNHCPTTLSNLRDPVWRSYFSNELKPPTRNWAVFTLVGCSIYGMKSYPRKNGVYNQSPSVVVFKWHFLFSPRTLGKMNPFWRPHIFQMGWSKNQQLVEVGRSYLILLMVQTSHSQPPFGCIKHYNTL